MMAVANFWFWHFPVMADAAPVDSLVSGNWIIAVIGAVASGAALFWGKSQKDEKDKAMNMKTTIEDQPVGIRVHEDFVTHGELSEHIGRIEGDISGIMIAMEGERGIARIANGNLHKRMDSMSENLGGRMGKIEGTVEGIKGNTDKLLDIALNHNPKGPTR